MVLRFVFSILLCTSLFCFGKDSKEDRELDVFLNNAVQNQSERNLPNYPNFSQNPCFSQTMRRLMAPYLLPLDHPIKSVLDEIFSRSRVISNEDTLHKAGFRLLFSQKRSFIRVVSHPRLPGYLLKIYLDSEQRIMEGPAGWKRLAGRCVVAKAIKEIIKKNHVRSFVVADKWLYPLPAPKVWDSSKQPVVLVVKNMNICNKNQSANAWKNRVSLSTVEELNTIFNHGYGSALLPVNLPYTKNHKFAFIDTEFKTRKLPVEHVERYLSSKMWRYWNEVADRQGKH